MLDVMFVLLLFFMVSMANQVVEMELGINVPSRGLPSHEDKPSTPIYIKINPQGAVFYNDSQVADPVPDLDPRDRPRFVEQNMAALRFMLEENVRNFGSDNTPVIIVPSDRVQHQRVVDVMNAAAAAGVTKLSFGSA